MTRYGVRPQRWEDRLVERIEHTFKMLGILVLGLAVNAALFGVVVLAIRMAVR